MGYAEFVGVPSWTDLQPPACASLVGGSGQETGAVNQDGARVFQNLLGDGLLPSMKVAGDASCVENSIENSIGKGGLLHSVVVEAGACQP